jgi:hypothetical protein
MRCKQLCQSSDRHSNRENAGYYFSYGRLFKLHAGHRNTGYAVSLNLISPLQIIYPLPSCARTVTAYSTITNTITLPGMKKRLQERQVTVVPSSAPGYTAACSTPGLTAAFVPVGGSQQQRPQLRPCDYNCE